MGIINHIEANRYEVSVDGGGVYLVDLDEYSAGACGCPDFQCRHMPKLQLMKESGITTFPEITCKHLRYLRAQLAAKSNKSEPSKDKEVVSTVASGGSNESEENCILHNPDRYPSHSVYWLIPESERKKALCSGCKEKDTCTIKTREVYS